MKIPLPIRFLMTLTYAGLVILGILFAVKTIFSSVDYGFIQ